MKKRILSKKVVGISLIVLVNLVFPQTVRGAVLQANPTTNSGFSRYELTSWMSLIRKMETSGQAMGLTEVLDSDGTLKGTTQNGIDVHMVKSTEYGAMAILSASGFGNPANTKIIDTTTGNKTGVYIQSSRWEWVAGCCYQTAGIYSTSKAQRYFNEYSTGNNSSKPGDALNLKWHSSECTWPEKNNYAIMRGGSFGFFGYGAYLPYEHDLLSRAVVVVSEGL